MIYCARNFSSVMCLLKVDSINPMSCAQALPLVTVVVGGKTTSGVCRVKTASDCADNPKFVEFLLPKPESQLQPGLPKWANYIKGVVACFPFAGMYLMNHFCSEVIFLAFLCSRVLFCALFCLSVCPLG